jgi:hypothetical protein
MRIWFLMAVFFLAPAVLAADVESRVLTHYLPQDFLETVVRTDGWTELKLDVKGGLRKGDVVRVWAGGSIDRGNGDQPGENTGGPAGPGSWLTDVQAQPLSLSQDRANAFALLFKAEAAGLSRCSAPGKPLEIGITRDREKLWIGFNDLRGHYFDNHLGRGRRHELDPLWIRIEVVRIIVD